MPASLPEPGLLVISVLGRTLELVDLAAQRCAEQFGRLLFASEVLPFEWTDYYCGELGASPARRLIALEGEGDAARLPELKRATCRLEVALSPAGGGRQLNLDPGVLGEGQLILASTKARAHRVHLGRGVHGDLQLLFGPTGFEPLPWTYPDYASPPMRQLLGRLRELLLQRRRASDAVAGPEGSAGPRGRPAPRDRAGGAP